ncbi:cytochrome P450 [Artemisia annua]|uniref:Cytochrome P450 n=1 Tax=Artemisia annua TaxID=35608 RepID=A0A2U1ML79_ARTAN|nr:cytochrome P450 [Artemisia annua]
MVNFVTEKKEFLPLVQAEWKKDIEGFQMYKVVKKMKLLKSKQSTHAAGEDCFLAVVGKWKGAEGLVGLLNVYGPRDEYQRLELLNKLGNLLGMRDVMWCIFGDFNEVRGPGDRMNSQYNERSARKFNEFIRECDLIDIPMGGRIDLHSLLCPCCENAVETTDHIMVRCSYASAVWSKIYGGILVVLMVINQSFQFQLSEEIFSGKNLEKVINQSFQFQLSEEIFSGKNLEKLASANLQIICNDWDKIGWLRYAQRKHITWIAKLDIKLLDLSPPGYKKRALSHNLVGLRVVRSRVDLALDSI